MELIQSWRESLALLKPPQVKILLFVTVKALKELFTNPYSLLVIVLLGITTTFSEIYYNFHELTRGSSIFFLISAALSIILTLLLILYIRPSVMPKNRFYFLHYWRHLLYILVLYAAFLILFIFFPSVMTYGSIVWLLLSTIWILFFCDRNATLKTFGHSLVRGVLMIVYNAPVLIIITIVWYALYIIFFATILYIVRIRSEYLLFAVFALNIIIFYPIWYCMMNTMYVKRLHDQFSLYFGRPIS